MANIKSAKKRIEVTAIRTAKNKAVKSKVKTAIKKVETAVANNDKEAAAAALKAATVEISKAQSQSLLKWLVQRESSTRTMLPEKFQD